MAIKKSGSPASKPNSNPKPKSDPKPKPESKPQSQSASASSSGQAEATSSSQTGANSAPSSPVDTFSPSTERDEDVRPGVSNLISGLSDDGPDSEVTGPASSNQNAATALDNPVDGESPTTSVEGSQASNTSETSHPSTPSNYDGPGENDYSTTDEKRVDLDAPPEGLEAGSDVPDPGLPDFSEHEPTPADENDPTTTSYQVDGVDYNVVKNEDGTSSTSYEVDGVTHTVNQNNEGVATSQQLDTTTEVDGEEVQHTRDISYDENGEVAQDRSTSQSGDEEAGQYRQVTVGADGEVGTEERVWDGTGESEFNRVSTGFGEEAREYYQRTASDGNVAASRETNVNADGSGTTKLATRETLDGVRVEEATDQEKCFSEDVMSPLPLEERGETVRTDAQTHSFDANGDTRFEGGEETFSQTSTSVEADVRTSQYVPGEVNNGREESTGLSARPEGENSLSLSVTNVYGPGENGGEPVRESQRIEQTASVAAQHEDGSPVTLSHTDSWDSATGLTTSTFGAEGLNTDDLSANTNPGFTMRAGAVERTYSLPAGNEDTHLVKKNEAEEHLQLGENGTFDLASSVARDGSGNVVNASTSYSTVGENGEGRSVVRHENQEGGVSWQYSDYTNGGQDYARQTVVEGTEISIEEFRKTTGENGEFEAGTTVKDGDDVISQSEAFKDRVNLDELTRLRNEGVVDGETYENMIRNQGPDAVYTVEHASESTEALTETVGEFQGYSGGSGQTRYPVYNQVEQLVMGEDGKPVRQGRSSSHTTVSNDTGYTESRGRDTLEGMGEIDGETVNQHGIVDPNGDPPIVIKTDKEVNGEKVDFAEGLNLGEVTVDKEGRVLVNGQEQENSDPGYLTAINDVNSLVGQSTGGYAALTAAFPNLNSSLSEISSAANGVAGAVSVGTGAYNFFTATNQEERLQGAIETVGGINGPLSIADTLLKGAGKQNSWLSKAAAFTDTFDNGVATPFARAVGVAGAVVALPGAIDDITNGPTAYHRNAGWMSAGSSALTAAGAIPSPATPFLWGGAAVLGLASLATQSVGESSTVARSEELFPGYTPAH